MKDNITVGEVKRRCAELTEKYGDGCCKHCEFGEMGCCDSPDNWNVEDNPELTSRPDWETMFKQSEESCRKMYMRCEDAERRADRADEEIRRLRLIIGTVETMIGRKFDV